MNVRTLLVAIASAATLTACANSKPTLTEYAQAREEGLISTSISGGACDGAGQMIPAQLVQDEKDEQAQKQGVSAAPVD